jgi:hypothetical protein
MGLDMVKDKLVMKILVEGHHGGIWASRDIEAFSKSTARGNNASHHYESYLI